MHNRPTIPTLDAFPDTLRCSRCGRTTDAGGFPSLSWEPAADGQSWVCEGCLTGAEQQAIDEDDMATADEAERITGDR